MKSPLKYHAVILNPLILTIALPFVLLLVLIVMIIEIGNGVVEGLKCRTIGFSGYRSTSTKL